MSDRMATTATRAAGLVLVVAAARDLPETLSMISRVLRWGWGAFEIYGLLWLVGTLAQIVAGVVLARGSPPGPGLMIVVLVKAVLAAFVAYAIDDGVVSIIGLTLEVFLPSAIVVSLLLSSRIPPSTSMRAELGALLVVTGGSYFVYRAWALWQLVVEMREENNRTIAYKLVFTGVGLLVYGAMGLLQIMAGRALTADPMRSGRLIRWYVGIAIVAVAGSIILHSVMLAWEYTDVPQLVETIMVQLGSLIVPITIASLVARELDAHPTAIAADPDASEVPTLFIWGALFVAPIALGRAFFVALIDRGTGVVSDGWETVVRAIAVVVAGVLVALAVTMYKRSSAAVWLARLVAVFGVGLGIGLGYLVSTNAEREYLYVSILPAATLFVGGTVLARWLTRKDKNLPNARLVNVFD